MQQCQKGKLQEIKEATYYVSLRRGDVSRNLGVLLCRQSTATNTRILCASQRAHNACRLSKEPDYLVRNLLITVRINKQRGIAKSYPAKETSF